HGVPESTARRGAGASVRKSAGVRIDPLLGWRNHRRPADGLPRPGVRCTSVHQQDWPLAMITAFANWLHATTLGCAAGGGVPSLEPAGRTLHFFGLALLFGCAGLFDLRMLG